jgi:hypothetical protein
MVITIRGYLFAFDVLVEFVEFVVVVVVVVVEFDLFALLAVLFAGAGPHAIPSAASAKRVESAIVFFILNLLSSSKN